jgi:hypothetical protein
VTATLPAWACLVTLARASWVTRSKVTSASGLSGLGVPVTVAVATRPVSSATLPASRPRASPSRAARGGAVRQRGLPGQPFG